MGFDQRGATMGEQTSGIRAVALIARDRTGRLPVGAGGREILGFATLSHSNLKSWAKIEAAQGHNTRAIDTPNARKDAPAPIELLDEKNGTYRERVKAILREHGAPGESVKIRKGGTIANEDVYGASPEYWNRSGSWRLKSVEEIRNDPVVLAAIALARRKHGQRLVSCSLHLDEESPHIHVISVPLVKRAHSKRGRKPEGTPRDAKGKPLEDSRPKVTKWTLDVSSIRGRSSDLEKNHDEWAEYCQPFGIVRGQRGSDMTTEQRRARRNRQTGRSSKAEMEARHERERLHEEAKHSRDRGAEYEEEAKAKADTADAHLRATKQEREKAETTLARARAQEADNEKMRRELDERKARYEKRESEIGEQVEQLKSETAIHNDQMRLIAKALDPANPFELHDREGRVEVEGGMDDRDRNANRGSWDWLTGGLGQLARRLTGLRNQEAELSGRLQEADATLEAARNSQEKLDEDRLAFRMSVGADRLRMGILEKVISPATTNRLGIKDGKVIVLDLTGDDKALVDQGPTWYRAAFDGFVERSHGLAKCQAEVGDREAAVRRREDFVAKLEAEKDQVAYQRAEFEKEKATWNVSLERAGEFLSAWEGIAPQERAPAINEALGKAEGLTTEDLPPGYTLPGKGGWGR